VIRSRPHGQTLLLFCLTSLLITLMVTLTLSFAMKVREKMEAQHVADLAAYSSAVATARTFNSIALMRRAQTAHLVAISGVQSLISWTSMMRAGLNATEVALAGCPPAAALLAPLDEQVDEIFDKWHELDAKAGVQAYNIDILGSFLYGQQNEMYDRLVESVSGGPNSFAQQFAQMASQGSPWSNELGGGATPVSVGELEHATSDGNSHGMDMAMATRGYEFLTRRQGMPPFTGNAGVLGILAGAGATVDFTNQGGSAYWGRALDHGGRADESDYTWAEDHADLQITFPGCPTFTIRASAHVKSSDFLDDTDDHVWFPASPRLGDQDVGMEKQFRHTLLPVKPEYVPSTFIGGITYNTSDDSDGNLWAQPKLFALVQRDYKVRGQRADPWSLRFTFRFSDEEKEFDNQGWELGDGTDISIQQALGTGLAYYHRRGNWQEPPNLWNPFWRATLVSADADSGGDMRQGGNDVPNTVGVALPVAAEAYRALINAGYKGVH
jgi:Putative Flp pilus-assembly TadE/G-like